MYVCHRSPPPHSPSPGSPTPSSPPPRSTSPCPPSHRSPSPWPARVVWHVFVHARAFCIVCVCSSFMSSPSRATSPSYTRPHSPLTPSPSHHLPHASMFSPHTFRTFLLIRIHSPARPRTLALTEDLVLTPSSSYICPHTLAPTPSLMTPYITLMPSPPWPHIHSKNLI